MHEYASPCAERHASENAGHPPHFDAARRAADCLDDHHAGLVVLTPETQELARGYLRRFLFINLGTPDAHRLAELSWIAADMLEVILDDAAGLFGEPC